MHGKYPFVLLYDQKVCLFSVGVTALHPGRIRTVSIVIEGTVLAHQALKGPKKSMINFIPKLNKNLSIMPFIWIIYSQRRNTKMAFQ